jgi:TolA-binding protein
MADAAIPSKHTRNTIMNQSNNTAELTNDTLTTDAEKSVGSTVVSLDEQITAVEGQLESLRAQRRQIGKVAQTRTQRVVKYTAIALTGAAVVAVGLRMFAGRAIEVAVDAALDA